MASSYVYPTAAELSEIAQLLIPRIEAQRPVFQIFPVETQDADTIMWEQEDNYTGLQQLRGLNGAPPVVKRPGAKRYVEQPGIYGEFTAIDETELTRRRAYGQFTQLVNITDLVTRAQNLLLARRYDRIEKIAWDLLVNGTFSVATPLGGTSHTGSYTTQTFTASPIWSTIATATPLQDFRAVQLKARGYSVRFDQSAMAFMSRVTLNWMLRNTNTNDLAGRRAAGLSSIASESQINMLLTGEGLPNIVVYDQGYLDDTGTFQLFIPDGKVVVVGKRTDGSPIGKYVMTRNATNPGLAPGAYTKVVDDDDAVPRNIQVHDGHNGGPALSFPSAIVVMTVL